MFKGESKNMKKPYKFKKYFLIFFLCLIMTLVSCNIKVKKKVVDPNAEVVEKVDNIEVKKNIEEIYTYSINKKKQDYFLVHPGASILFLPLLSSKGEFYTVNNYLYSYNKDEKNSLVYQIDKSGNFSTFMDFKESFHNYVVIMSEDKETIFYVKNYANPKKSVLQGLSISSKKKKWTNAYEQTELFPYDMVEKDNVLYAFLLGTDFSRNAKGQLIRTTKGNFFVVALNGSNGQEKWRTEIITAKPTLESHKLLKVGKENLYVFIRENVYAVSKSTGEVKWSKDLKKDNFNFDLDKNDDLYIVNSDKLVKYNSQGEETIIASSELEGFKDIIKDNYLGKAFVIGKDNLIYLDLIPRDKTNKSSNLVAINTKEKKVQWKQELVHHGLFKVVLAIDNQSNIYSLSLVDRTKMDKVLKVMNGKTGKILKVKENIFEAPYLIGLQETFMKVQNGNIYWSNDNTFSAYSLGN